MSFDYSTLVPQGPVATPVTLALLVYGGRYVLLAGLFYWMAKFRWGRPDRAEDRTRQTRKSRHLQIVREMKYSAVTIFIFGILTLVFYSYGFSTYSQLYWKIPQYGWAWFWLSIPVMVLMHDASFYWLHRLLHTRLLYRGVHRFHHLSIHPTAWAAYSFHPVEAVLEIVIGAAMFYVIPVHPLAFVIFQTIPTLANVYVHCGREFFPNGLMHHWLGRWINTSVAHHTHHATNRHNYGLYFLFWDRMMGTLDKTYR